MKIALPDAAGTLTDYPLTGTPIESVPLGADAARVVFAATHVVADPFTANDPSGPAALDWEATMRFRRHLAELGLGIAEAMDTAQRGMGRWRARATPAPARSRYSPPRTGGSAPRTKCSTPWSTASGPCAECAVPIRTPASLERAPGPVQA